MKENILMLPENLLRGDMFLVSIRTQAILQLTSLNEEQKRQAIEEMIDRKMKELVFASEFQKTR